MNFLLAALATAALTAAITAAVSRAGENRDPRTGIALTPTRADLRGADAPRAESDTGSATGAAGALGPEPAHDPAEELLREVIVEVLVDLHAAPQAKEEKPPPVPGPEPGPEPGTEPSGRPAGRPVAEGSKQPHRKEPAERPGNPEATSARPAGVADKRDPFVPVSAPGAKAGRGQAGKTASRPVLTALVASGRRTLACFRLGQATCLATVGESFSHAGKVHTFKAARGDTVVLVDESGKVMLLRADTRNPQRRGGEDARRSSGHPRRKTVPPGIHPQLLRRLRMQGGPHK